MSKSFEAKSQLTINATELFRYLEWRAVTLIPLHAYDSVTIKQGRTIKNGKRPLDAGWRTRPYVSRDVIKRCLDENRNVGVRLGDTVLVIDVDPRHNGEKSFAEFCERFPEFKPEKFPCVITGGGGYHYYGRKPRGLKIVDTVEDFPGIEFKSIGRQVVAAGSIHPDTLKHYEWAFGTKTFEGMQ